MDRVKLVVTSDNHLNRHYDRLTPARLAERRRWLRGGFDAAVQYALDHRADVLVQAGDLFDTPDPRNGEREHVARQFARLRAADITVVGIGGNHDTPKQRTEHGGALPQAVYAHLDGLHLLVGDGLPTLTLDVRGTRLQLGALPWLPTRTVDDDPLADVLWEPKGDVNVFLLHHSIEGHIYPAANEAIVRRAAFDRLGRTQLVVAGHVHHHAHWTQREQTILIPGATERMTFGDTVAPGFVWVEVGAHGVERLDHVSVPVQPRRDLSLHSWALRAAGDDLCAAAMRQIEAVGTPELLLRVRLQGPISREDYRALDLRRLWECGVQRAFACELDVSGLLVEDDFGARAVGGVRVSQHDELVASGQALIAEATDSQERDLLHAALQAVLAAHEQGTPA